MRSWSTKCISCQMRLSTQLPCVLVKLLVMFINTSPLHHKVKNNDHMVTLFYDKQYLTKPEKHLSQTVFFTNFCPINRFPFCQFNIS